MHFDAIHDDESTITTSHDIWLLYFSYVSCVTDLLSRW